MSGKFNVNQGLSGNSFTLPNVEPGTKVYTGYKSALGLVPRMASTFSKDMAQKVKILSNQTGIPQNNFFIDGNNNLIYLDPQDDNYKEVNPGALRSLGTMASDMAKGAAMANMASGGVVVPGMERMLFPESKIEKTFTDELMETKTTVDDVSNIVSGAMAEAPVAALNSAPAAAAALPAGLGIPASTALGSATEGVRQGIGNILAGDPITDIDAGQVGMAGAMSGGMDAGFRGVSSMLKQNVPGALPKQDLQSIKQAMENRTLPEVYELAKSFGIDLDLSQLIDTPTMRQIARRTRRQPGTADLFQEFFIGKQDLGNFQLGGQYKQLTDAIEEIILPRINRVGDGRLQKGDLDAMNVVQSLINASTELHEKLIKQRTAYTSVHFRNAFKLTPKLPGNIALRSHIFLNRAAQDISDKALKDPEIAFIFRDLAKKFVRPQMKDGKPVFQVDGTGKPKIGADGQPIIKTEPITRTETLNAVRTEIQDMIQQIVDGKSKYPSALPVLQNAYKNLVDSMKEASPPFRNGMDKYEEFTAKFIDPFEKSLAATLKSTPDYKSQPVNALSGIFNYKNANPKSIKNAFNQFKKMRGGEALFRNAMRAYFTQQFREIEDTILTGAEPMNYAKNTATQVLKAFFKKQNLQVLSAVMDNPADVKLFEKFAVVLSRIRNTLPEGSPTASDLKLDSQVLTLPEKAAEAAINVDVTKPLSVLGLNEKAIDILYGRGYERLAKIMTSKDAINEIKKLRELKPDSKTAQIIVLSILNAAGKGAFDNYFDEGKPEDMSLMPDSLVGEIVRETFK